MKQSDDEKYHNGSKIQGNHKCKISVNISVFLSHFFDFHGSKVKGYAHTVAYAPIPLTERGNFREPQAQIEVTHRGRDSNPASTVSQHYNFPKLNAPIHSLSEGDCP